MDRGIAQPGRAPGLGPGGRVFESLCPDHSFIRRFLGNSRFWRTVSSSFQAAVLIGTIGLWPTHVFVTNSLVHQAGGQWSRRFSATLSYGRKALPESSFFTSFAFTHSPPVPGKPVDGARRRAGRSLLTCPPSRPRSRSERQPAATNGPSWRARSRVRYGFSGE